MRVRVGDVRITAAQKEAILALLDSDRISEGPNVRDFERRWGDYIGTKYAIATNSGSSALTCVLAALERLGMVEPGDKVITSPLTYIATASSIVAAGLRPVFVDVDRAEFWIRPSCVRDALKEHPDARVLIPVHLMGYPAPLVALGAIANRSGMILIEDAAQAHGSEYNGGRVGSIGLAGIFSFYVAHNIQAGEMGAVTTSSRELQGMVRQLKAQGRRCACVLCTRSTGACPQLPRSDGPDPRFTHDVIGFNFKTTEFSAALALDQLSHIGGIIQKRQLNVKFLNSALAQYRDRLQLPPPSGWSLSPLAYPLVIREGSGLSRNELCRALEGHGIETRPLFGCIPTQQPAFGFLRNEYAGKLPNAEYLGANGFYIGCHQYLTQADLEHVVTTFQHLLD
jgi:dTDP-4-amino-4,6-dideoxygalactose transaminase